jgi:hypothetical protein
MEPPALLVVEMNGVVTPDDALALQRLLFEVGDQVGSFDILADVSRMGRFEGRARSVFGHPDRTYRIRRIAVAGASFTTRAVLMMLTRAGRALRPDSIGYTSDYFATTHEARRWLAEPVSASIANSRRS